MQNRKRKIQNIEKSFKDEWVLIEVLETDEQDIPIRGRLLHHSKSRETIHRKIMKMDRRGKDLYVRYCGEVAPPNEIVIL